ncbi:MAG: hypothetical protein JW768_07410 [Chitinispirillaceae bacterium]|nr:hypothetical protein [Chitinispirillaceae bacterium]
MITVITLCRNPMPRSVQERNLARTAGAPYEYKVIDAGKAGLAYAAAYNWACEQLSGDLLLFLAEDCYFMSMNWAAALERKFAGDGTLGVCGIAGTQHLMRDKYSWTAAGRPFVKGRLIYHLQNSDFFAVAFSTEKADHEVVACDGGMLAARTSLVRQVGFDHETFAGEHFWDLDFCVRARKEARIVVTSDVTVKRMAQPSYSREWHEAGKAFLKKHANALPLTCADYPGAPLPGPSAPMVNLRGKYSPDTIC